MSAIPKATRQAVYDRERGLCFHCGIGNATDPHHRKRRREGGHGMENLVLLCRACHAWAHANHTMARAHGLIVSVHGDPRGVPVRRWDGAWILLDTRGKYEFCFE